ncbi:MAG: hypothetical protein PHG97_02515 [Candidatus Margulisbacteria bacterium]|nr:hypothetical protein [Candidatus Margulisiibacteriota bacterium]
MDKSINNNQSAGSVFAAQNSQSGAKSSSVDAKEFMRVIFKKLNSITLGVANPDSNSVDLSAFGMGQVDKTSAGGLMAITYVTGQLDNQSNMFMGLFQKRLSYDDTAAKMLSGG